MNSTCLSAFLLPFGARQRPRIRKTLDPRTAGALHRSPLRFHLARHLDARRIAAGRGGVPPYQPDVVRHASFVHGFCLTVGFRPPASL